ncbi:MAG: sugar transferase [Nanoarchaeota archaeon]|nr:sugar transferase [Nanoarchaeota archaeon]
MLEDLFYTTTKVGKNGKPFTFRKIRTMVKDASSDRCRLIQENGRDSLGKIVEDPRIIPGRRFLRRYGIDELPQFYNVLKGEMALVGIRPRTEEEWSVDPEELKEMALEFKPGLVSPPYAYKNLEEVGGSIAVEMDYLRQKEQHPIQTDIKYFFRVMYNILFRGTRSS